MGNVTKIKGFADFIPEESRTMQTLEDAARDVFGRYGYGELRTPILEKTELFCRSIGDETDVVQKEMYTFPDRKNRSLTMRPEATAGVMRALIENKLYAKQQVNKVFTMGPMFRYERPQKGRMRQFHQINAECIGPAEPQADAEVILMLMLFFQTVGIENLTLEINSLGCKECRPKYHAALKEYFTKLDQSALCEDCRRRMETNPLRVLDCKVPACKELTQDAPTLSDHLCGECEEHFAVVLTLLDDNGQSYVRNHRLVRGLDYYTRTTFEIVAEGIGAQSSVAGGGRYDGLVKQLGGPEVPGIGFAMGMERLGPLLPAPDDKKMDFYLAVLEEGGLQQGMALAQQLREQNLSGVVSFASKSLKSQMREANKQGARSCLLMGSEELAKDTITFKDMESGEQQSLPRQTIDQLVELIHAAG